MKHYAGLDVSLKETSICIVDEAGSILREMKVPSHPEDLVRTERPIGASIMIRDATDTPNTEPSGTLDGTEGTVVRPAEPVHPQSASSGPPMRVLENVWKRLRSRSGTPRKKRFGLLMRR